MSAQFVPGLVSVVVASYNHAAYLTKRMDCLIAQTYKEIEIIVIDDCSTDESLAVLSKYRSQPCVRLVAQEKNSGWVCTSNHGMGLARGEFLLFANCDDECDLRMVERLVRALKLHPSAGIAFCRSLLIDEAGYVLGEDIDIREANFKRRCQEDTLLSQSEASRFLLHSCVIPNLSAAMFRRTGLERIGAFTDSFRVCADWDLFFRFARAYDVAYVAESLNRFRQHSRTIRNTTRDRIVYAEYIRLLLEQISILELGKIEKTRFRFHVMYLWMVHVFQPSIIGVKNVPYHFRWVRCIDPAALLFVMPAAVMRVAQIVFKAVRPSRRRHHGNLGGNS